MREPAFRSNLQFVLVVRPRLRWRKKERTVEEESKGGTDDVNLRRCLSLLFSASSSVFSFFTCVLGSYRHDKPGTLHYFFYIYIKHTAIDGLVRYSKKKKKIYAAAL